MEHKSKNKKEIQKKLREFFQSTKWKNFLTFLVFVALAFIFWIVQYFQQRFEADVYIPVYYSEIPDEIVITNRLPEKIDAKVVDKGTMLLNYYFKKNLDPIEINLSGIPLERNNYTVDQQTIYKQVQDRLVSLSEIKAIFPEKIEIEYSPLAQKIVPVKLDGILSPASGYIISDSLTISPKEVIVYGDAKTLDSLSFVLTTPIEKKDINQYLNIDLDLLAPSHVRLSEKKVRLTLQVEEYTEKVFELPIICSNLPPDHIIRFFPSMVEVHVQVGLSHYAETNVSDFEIDLDYDQLILSNSASYQLELNKFPSEILNYHIIPETVEFLVEQKNEP